MSIVRIFGPADPLYNEFSAKCLSIFLVLIFLDSFQIVGSSFCNLLENAPLQQR